MIGEHDMRPLAGLLRDYQDGVQKVYPAHVGQWPLVNGWDFLQGTFNGWTICIVQDRPYKPMCAQSGIGEIAEGVIGAPKLTPENLALARKRVGKHFRIENRDAVLFFDPDGRCFTSDLEAMMADHEVAMGLASMKIFLSHKGVDKTMVRRFERLLRTLGFDPWLDEDAMPAGSQPDRAIQKGFKDSCAAVFFVTPEFKDETWLATEIEYARTERREKGEQRFAIITLCLTKDGKPGNVPDLLRHFIYKSPEHELDAMLEIVRALPLKLGEPQFR